KDSCWWDLFYNGLSSLSFSRYQKHSYLSDSLSISHGNSFIKYKTLKGKRFSMIHDFSNWFWEKIVANIDSRLFLFESRRCLRSKFPEEKNSDLAQRTTISCGK